MSAALEADRRTVAMLHAKRFYGGARAPFADRTAEISEAWATEMARRELADSRALTIRDLFRNAPEVELATVEPVKRPPVAEIESPDNPRLQALARKREREERRLAARFDVHDYSKAKVVAVCAMLIAAGYLAGMVTHAGAASSNDVRVEMERACDSRLALMPQPMRKPAVEVLREHEADLQRQ